MPRLYLASASPRRRELLTQIGVAFSVKSADIDESVQTGESPEVYVKRLAQAKAQAVLATLTDTDAVVLGADTCVVQEGRILGKPTDFAEAKQMLGALSGCTHQVLTAVALVSAAHQEVVCVSTSVRFGTLTDAQIAAYWASGEPCDKAGSYGIQGLGAVFVEHIQGSYSAVVGLPLYETCQLLKRFNIGIWQHEG